MNNTDYQTIELYGGAFTISCPKRFNDISFYRPIPDHQEVYVDSDFDQSIIVELNSYQDVPNEKAIALHWEDLMKDSDSAAAIIERQGQLTAYDIPNTKGYVSYVGWADGVTKVGKYKEESLNTIRTYMVNMRLECVTTDLLIIFNIPVSIDDSSAAVINTDKRVMSKTECDSMIQTVVSSFTVESMSIFPEMQ